MELNNTIIDQLESVIEHVWDQIGPDVLGSFPNINNLEAIEVSIDADRLITIAENPNAQTLVGDLVEEHGYIKTLRFLAKHIKLN